MEAYDKPEHAGESIFGAILESAPSLQSLFKSQKLIAAKFISSVLEVEKPSGKFMKSHENP